MKSSIKLTAIFLSLLMIVSIMPITGIAYGSTDKKLVITHLNNSVCEGAGVIITPSTGDTIASGYAYWVLVTFDWNETDYCYKVSKVQGANGVDKSSTIIPENGFVYAVNFGNNYPKLYEDEGDLQYANKPNYVNSRTSDSYNYANSLAIGTKAYVYNSDLLNGILDNNGAEWYTDSYVTNSYIKIGTPDTTGILYDPNNTQELLIQHTFDVTDIDAYGANTGMSIIFTRNYGTDIFGSNDKQQYYWWKTAVFEWNDTDKCYVVTSLDLALDNNSAKQPVIPEDGFVLAVITGNTATDAASINMDKLKIGTKVFVYGADLKAGTITDSAKICANLPDSSLTAYVPTLSGTRLAAPELTNMTEKRTVTTDAGFTVKWNAVEGATSYVVNINNSSYVTNGLLKVNAQNVTETSYTIGNDILAIGNIYTVSVYAIGTGMSASTLSHAKLAVISEEAFSSSLRNKTIVAFGDSLTARNGWVNLLGGRLGADVINSGVGGDKTNEGKARFAAQVVANKPDIVIINFGMNDQAVSLSTGKPLVSLETYTTNLEYFAAALTEADIDVIFATPNPVCTATGYYVPGGYGIDYSSDSILAFCDAMRKVAVKYECGLVDINKECASEDLAKFCNAGDGIHQSTYGHEQYAKYLGDYLTAVYDNKNLSSVEIKYVDAKGTQLADPVTFKGTVGSSILIPGKKIDGYNLATNEKSFTFTSAAGTVMFEYAPPSSIEIKEDSKCVIKDSFIFINDDEITSENLLGQIKNENVICVLKSGILVGTGSKLQLKSGDTVVSELTVILLGDASGDGKVNSVDFLYVKRHFMETYTLKGEFLTAADVDNDGNITSADYLKIKRHFLDTYNIYAK